jgi:hypothetical protein
VRISGRWIFDPESKFHEDATDVLVAIEHVVIVIRPRAARAMLGGA